MAAGQLTVEVLRELLRHHQAWHSLFEAREVEDVLEYQDIAVSLWDLDYLVVALKRLPPRQREAIQYCFLEGMRESDAAVRMGVSPTNPVSMYANEGVKKILVMIVAGDLPRFRYEAERESA